MKDQIHSDPFSPRLEAVRALSSIAKSDVGSLDLKEIASSLDSLSVELSSASSAKAYAAFADLLRIVDALVIWRSSVLSAEPDADRFLRSAKERHRLWDEEYRDAESCSHLLASAIPIGSASAISEVKEIARSILTVPLPVAIYSTPVRPPHLRTNVAEPSFPEEVIDLTVAFLKFSIDGVAASEVHQVTPGEVHDLEIEVRVSRWPEDKRELVLTPVSVEPKSTYDFPLFHFERPLGPAPFVMRQSGRAALLLRQGVFARPFEFKYTAEFMPERGEQPIAIVGHRTLTLDGAETASFKLCGYPSIDRRLLGIRENLRRRGGVPQTEAADALLLLSTLCNLAGRAVQDAEFSGHWSEAEFQKKVRAELRRNPAIGTSLDEHANAGGGITDLSFHGLPIELKVVDKLIRGTDECAQFLPQTASYAVANSKHTAILCVLDSSQKSIAPVSPETLLEPHIEKESGVCVCVLVIQGNLARPSSLSR